MFEIVISFGCTYLLTGINTYEFTRSIKKLDKNYIKIIKTEYSYGKYEILGLTNDGYLIDMIFDKILYDNISDVVIIKGCIFILMNNKIYKYDSKKCLIYINENVKKIICNNNFGYYIDNNNNKFLINLYINRRFHFLLEDEHDKISKEVLEIEITEFHVLFIFKDRVLVDSLYKDLIYYISSELINKYNGKDYYYINSFGEIIKYTQEIKIFDNFIIHFNNNIYLIREAMIFKDDMIYINNQQYDIYSLLELIKDGYFIDYFNIKNLPIDKQDIQELIIFERSVFIKKQDKLYVYGSNYYNYLGISDNRKFIDKIIDTGLEFPHISNVKSARKI